MVDDLKTEGLDEKTERFKEAFGTKKDSVEEDSQDQTPPKSDNSVEESDDKQRDWDRKVKAQATLVWKAASKLALTTDSEEDFDKLYEEDPKLADKVIEAKFGKDLKSYDEYKKFQRLLNKKEPSDDDSNNSTDSSVKNELAELREWRASLEERDQERAESERQEAIKSQKNKFLERYPEYRDEDNFKKIEEVAQKLSMADVLEAAHAKLGGEIRSNSYSRDELVSIPKSSGGDDFEPNIRLTAKEKSFAKAMGLTKKDIIERKKR